MKVEELTIPMYNVQPLTFRHVEISPEELKKTLETIVDVVKLSEGQAGQPGATPQTQFHHLWNDPALGLTSCTCGLYFTTPKAIKDHLRAKGVLQED